MTQYQEPAAGPAPACNEPGIWGACITLLATIASTGMHALKHCRIGSYAPPRGVARSPPPSAPIRGPASKSEVILEPAAIWTMRLRRMPLAGKVPRQMECCQGWASECCQAIVSACGVNCYENSKAACEAGMLPLHHARDRQICLRRTNILEHAPLSNLFGDKLRRGHRQLTPCLTMDDCQPARLDAVYSPDTPL